MCFANEHDFVEEKDVASSLARVLIFVGFDAKNAVFLWVVQEEREIEWQRKIWILTQADLVSGQVSGSVKHIPKRVCPSVRLMFLAFAQLSVCFYL